MRKLLTRQKLSGKMAEIYTDPEDPEVFHVSYILDVTEDSILECCVGVHGEFDGYAAEYIRDICHVESETPYLRKLERLGKRNFFKADIGLLQGQPISLLVNLAILQRQIAALDLWEEEDSLTGYLTKLEDGRLLVRLVSDLGEDEGETVISLSDIRRILVGDVETRELDYLYHYED